MRKNKFLIILIIMLFLFLNGCVHKHNIEEIKIEATCLSGGYTLYQCDCGYEYKGEETERTDHKYGEWKVIKEATESEKGLKEKYCIFCEHKVEEIIEEVVHVHELSEWSIIEEESSLSPGLKKRECLTCNYEEEETINSLEGMNVILDKSYFALPLNEEFCEEVTGVLTNGNTTYALKDEDFYFSRRSYNMVGKYSQMVTVVFYGKTYRVTIEIDVKNYFDEEKKVELDFINNIKYIIEDNEYLYLCDESSIYKYDLINSQLISSIKLDGIVNGHCIYKGYLYLTEYDANNKYQSEDEECYGAVTQIDLSTFTIYKRINVNMYPKGIVVDKREDIIIGEGNNSDTYLHYIDINTGELTKIFSYFTGNLFIYHEETDVLLEIEITTTQTYLIHSYRSYGYTERGFETDADYHKVLKVKNFIIVQADTIGYCKYEGIPGVIRQDCYAYYNLKDNINRHYKYISAEVDDKNVYLLCESDEKDKGNYDTIVLISKLYTKEYERYAIKMEADCKILNTYSYNGKIYIVTSLNELIVLNNVQ